MEKAAGTLAERLEQVWAEKNATQEEILERLVHQFYLPTAAQVHIPRINFVLSFMLLAIMIFQVPQYFVADITGVTFLEFNQAARLSIFFPLVFRYLVFLLVGQL